MSLPQKRKYGEKFTTTTIVVVIIVIIFSLGVGLSLFFTRAFDRFVFERIVKSEEIHVQVHSDVHLLVSDCFEDWQRLDCAHHFEDFFHDMRSASEVVRINLFNRDGKLIYSSVGGEVGRLIGEEDVTRALVGEAVFNVAHPIEAGLPEVKRLLELYIPIRVADGVVGVAELYFDNSGVVTLTRQMRFWVWTSTLSVIAFVAFLLYFTFKKQNEYTIRQAKELAAIVEKSPIGIYTINKDGIIKSANPRMVELEGFKNVKEIIGLNALELAAYKNCDCGLDRYLRGGLNGKSFEVEVRHLTSDEKERFQHYFGMPLFESNGKTVKQLLLLVEDITERKRLEAKIVEYTKELERKVAERTADLEGALAEAKKLSSIVENSFEGVIIADREGIIKYANPAWEKITGWNADEVVGKVTPRILKSGKQDDVFYKNLWETIMQGAPVYAEVVNKRKDGSFYDAEVVIFPLKVGNETMFVEISRDITERKQLDEAKTSFISVASHQLRTPLSSMRWITEMLLGGDLGALTKEQKSFIQDISTSNQRLINLVNALLASTRLEAGRVAIQPVSINLLKSTKEILETLRGLIDAKKLKVTLNSVSPSLPTINLEPEAFRQVVLNLISNAINYTANGGAITINLELKDDYVLFLIKDTGIGIPKKDQARIFEKFFRANNAMSFMPDGTGLGLSLAKALALSWRGKIWFESEEGKGTTFFFTIPLAGMESKKGEVGLTT